MSMLDYRGRRYNTNFKNTLKKKKKRNESMNTSTQRECVTVRVRLGPALLLSEPGGI